MALNRRQFLIGIGAAGIAATPLSAAALQIRPQGEYFEVLKNFKFSFCHSRDCVNWMPEHLVFTRRDGLWLTEHPEHSDILQFFTRTLKRNGLINGPNLPWRGVSGGVMYVDDVLVTTPEEGVVFGSFSKWPGA